MAEKKRGRPTRYRASYCDAIIHYFDRPPKQVVYKRTYYPDGQRKSEEPVFDAAQYPTFELFAQSIGVCVDTLQEWKKVHPAFAQAYARAKQLQMGIWLVNGMDGSYNATFAKFIGMNCFGLREQKEVAVDLAVVGDEEAKRKLEALGYGRDC